MTAIAHASLSPAANAAAVMSSNADVIEARVCGAVSVSVRFVG